MQVDVSQQGRNRRSLRGPALAPHPLPVFEDTGSQPFLDQPQDPRIPDPVLDEFLHPSPTYGIEETADVGITHPVHLLPADPGRQCVERIMRASPRSKPVGKTEEVRLVDCVHHFDDRSLDDLVLQSRDAERPLPPVRLRKSRETKSRVWFFEEGPPALRRRPPVMDHVLGYCGLREVDAKLEQLSVDPGCAPQWVFAGHAADEVADLPADGRSARAVWAALPSPLQPKTDSMPARTG